jgi:hypothetical protein
MSVSAPMTLKEFRDYLGKLPKALNTEIIKGIHVGADQAVGIAIRAGDTAIPASEHGKKGAFDTGNYRRNWHVTKGKDGAVVRNDATYAGIIEGRPGLAYGRRPGRKAPPTAVIARWLERRGGLDPKKAKQAAFPVARAIGRRGLRARRVLEGARPKIIKAVLAEVRMHVKKALRGGK